MNESSLDLSHMAKDQRYKILNQMFMLSKENVSATAKAGNVSRNTIHAAISWFKNPNAIPKKGPPPIVTP
jgi:hypothetical protein